VLPEIASVYLTDFGSPDLEDAFFEQYARVQELLKKLLFCGPSGDVVIMSGEGMVALWGGLKSVLKPGDKVLALASGVYGYGVGDMARQVGAQVQTVGLEFDQAFTNSSLTEFRQKLEEFKPKLVTVIHCETPSGTLNPINEIGNIIKTVSPATLFYVDFVSSGFGSCVHVCNDNIDIGLLGSQKCLGLIPDLSVITVSPKAWHVVEDVKYVGYDALKGWRTVCKDKETPYTHNWRGIAALEKILHKIQEETIEKVWERHQKVAAHCRSRISQMGLKLYPAQESFASPTVTAVYVPEGWTFDELYKALSSKHVKIAGSYGKIAGKIFRIGHMGHIQCQLQYMDKALTILEEVLRTKK